MSTEFLGHKVDTLTFDEAVKKASSLMCENRTSQVVTINPEMFECAASDSDFSNIINNAEIVIPDGVGVKIGLLLNGIKTDRIPGIDFAKELLKICAEKGLSVGIVGAKEEVIQKAAENLKNELTELNIVYLHNGYFKDDNIIYDDLKKSGADLILVAMGSPRQEKFINGAKNFLDKGLMIGIGGSLDVWSGMVARAPLVFQKTGTEWLYRTITQPSRFKRIFPVLPIFLIKSILYKFFK